MSAPRSPVRLPSALALGLVLALWACGDDAGPETDGGAGTIDAGSTAQDARTGTTADAGSGGGSTVGMICANDTNCTGAGEVCCLESSPYVCRLETDCTSGSLGIPCTASADCPSSRICCRLGDDQMCMREMDCANLGGEALP